MPAVEQQDNRFLIADLVPHPIAANSDAILILIVFQLDTASGTRVFLQRNNPFQQSLTHTIRKVV